MPVYRLTLTSERYTNNSGRPYRPEIVEFSSKEEMDSYKNGEYHFCINEYKNYARAWTIKQREEAFSELIAMRKIFRDKWFNKQNDNEKELA